MNDVGRLLSDFELLNELDVLEDGVGVSADKFVQEVGLELCELDDELLLFSGERLFLCFEFWLLDTHDHSEELIFETGFSDNEVDDCALSGRLGLVVRVDELGLEVEFEGRSDFNVLGSEFDEDGLSFLDELTREQWVKDSIDVLSNTVDDEGLTAADSELDLLLPTGGRELDGDHLASLLTSDPLDTLELWIDEEWVTTARYDDSGVLNRDSIRRKALGGPEGTL